MHVINEVLLYRTPPGVNSGRGNIDFYKKKWISLREVIFPGTNILLWCLKNIGKKFILKNLDWFIILVIYGWFRILQDLKNKKY